MSRIRRVGVLAALLALTAPVLSGVALPPSAAAPTAESGVVCTTDPNGQFAVTASDGYVSTPDGNTIYMWGYGADSFQLPGPVLCVTEGDAVTVTLTNTLPEPVSMVFPGLSDVSADGVPAQPQFASGRLTSLVQAAPANGGTVTYTFTAARPGTYFYQSGTDSAKQVQMGLFGAMIIRPAGFPGRAYSAAATAFNPAAEYVMLLSEVDPDLHAAVENSRPYDVTTLHPRYWMVNGRSFPDTISPNGASWLAKQPYGSLVHIAAKTAANPLPALVRYASVGTRIHPFHPHGNHGRVIGRDAHALDVGGDGTYEKFLTDIGPMQTWDVTYDWTDVEQWRPNTNPIPVPLPQQQNLTYKDDATWYSGSPYLGVTDDLPVGVTSYNECGEFYQMWHSHALNEAANYEAGFGGMTTLERIDPPGGCP